MINRISLGLLLTLGAWAGVASAHHSFAMFDQAQTRTLVGTVKQVQWTNPHIWVQVLVKDEKTGGTAEWSIEGLAGSGRGRCHYRTAGPARRGWLSP